MKKLLLIGAGSGSREILLLVDRINARALEWQVLGFVDEDPAKIGTEVDGLPVFGSDHAPDGSDIHGTSGIQEPATRERMLAQYVESRGYGLATLIAPDVVLPRDFSAGAGCVIFPGVIVSFDVQLGKGVLVLWHAALGHHLRVGQFATILTGALIMGGCKVGARSTIGGGAVLNVKVTVGANALVGVGTTVFQNVADGKRVVALPRLMNMSEQATGRAPAVARYTGLRPRK